MKQHLQTFFFTGAVINIILWWFSLPFSFILTLNWTNTNCAYLDITLISVLNNRSFDYRHAISKKWNRWKYNTVSIIQILNRVEGSIDFIYPRRTNNCPTRSGGQYICSEGANIINFSRKQSTFLFLFEETNKKGFQSFLSST